MILIKVIFDIYFKFWFFSDSVFYNKWVVSVFEEKCYIEFFEGEWVCNYMKRLELKLVIFVMS